MVDGRQNPHSLLQGREGGSVGAEIAQVRTAHREERPIRVKRQLGLDPEIATLIVTEEGFAALAGPLDRPTDAVRRPGEQGPFGIEKVARAETAAHLFAEDAHPLCRHAQRMGEIKPGLGNAAAGPTVECVLFACGVVCRHSRARLERDAGHTLHPGIETHDVGGTREGA